jgi:hypothetical protein
MSETIRIGPNHLGNCPRCGYAIESLEYAEPHYDPEQLSPCTFRSVVACCITGHTLLNPEIVALINAPSPIYPS